MRLPFGGRNEELETMNRILTEAAQKRRVRIEELERRVAQLERELKTPREAIERAKLLEVVAAERAQLLNAKDKQLADVRELTRGPDPASTRFTVGKGKPCTVC